MQNIRFFLAAAFLFTFLSAGAQNKEIVLGYISAYKEIAIEEMQRTGVPASIKLAQGIHETLAGTSDLVLKSNNHFGIKCKSSWSGPSVSHDDDARGECFRKYGSAFDSYRDHSDFLKGSPRYASLFKLDPLNYSAWAYGLKKAGYATNPKYPQIIIRLIEEYSLQEYTLIAMGNAPRKEEPLANADREEAAAVVMVSSGPKEEAGDALEKFEPAAPIYPDREFKINETKVIFARKGSSFLSIANQYKISLARIFEFNELKEAELVEKDQLLFLQRKRKTGSNAYHIVRPGETLYDIAQEEAIRLESLLAFNHLQSHMVPAAGSKLYLRAESPARPVLVANEADPEPLIARIDQQPGTARGDGNGADGDFIIHVVQPKETLYSISRKYKVRVSDITEWNELSGRGLKRGQQLRIYK